MSAVPTAHAVLLASTSGAHTSVGEAVTFWIVAPIVVIAAFGMVFARNAIHSALSLAFVMVGLAVFYAVQDAPFLAFVQVIVYTGAIMMLFLFVLMLVGVETRESLVETLRGHRLATAVVTLLFAVVVVAGIRTAYAGTHVVSKGLAAANAGGNPLALAKLVFRDYVWPFEVTSALLITGALGAMVLAHRERLTPRLTQRDLMRRRLRSGRVSPLPGPGVFARHDSVDTPALLPDGSVAPESINHVITEHGGAWSADSHQIEIAGLDERERAQEAEQEVTQ